MTDRKKSAPRRPPDAVLDDPQRREALLTGRAQVIREAIDLANRVGGGVDPDGPREAILRTLLDGWLEMMHFLDQAAQEAEDELSLLSAQRAR